MMCCFKCRFSLKNIEPCYGEQLIFSWLELIKAILKLFLYLHMLLRQIVKQTVSQLYPVKETGEICQGCKRAMMCWFTEVHCLR